MQGLMASESYDKGASEMKLNEEVRCGDKYSLRLHACTKARLRARWEGDDRGRTSHLI